MQSMRQSSGSPQGKWLHSFEEDESGIEVYRPADRYAFPPARRGREVLEFGGTGTLTMSVPGPDDRPREQPGRWVAIGMNRFRLEDGSQIGRTIEIVESTPDILKIRAR